MPVDQGVRGDVIAVSPSLWGARSGTGPVGCPAQKSLMAADRGVRRCPSDYGPRSCRLSLESVVVRSLVYLALRRFIELLPALLSVQQGQRVEILVLRHELEILRRQQPRPRLEPSDRAWLSLLSRLLPRGRWSIFLVRPETLLGSHRHMVRRHWTYPNTGNGRPPVPDDIQSLNVRLAVENPRWGYQPSKASWPGSASRCRARPLPRRP
jgi:hypothetical protein